MTMPALSLTGLTKAFDKPAVDRLDLTVRSGELYALLGPNGAGKTTTLRMVAGLQKPDAGGIRIFGIDALADPIAAKRIVAWLPDEPMLYDKLDPLEYLEFVAGLWGVPPDIAGPRAEELLRWLDLWDQRGSRCEGFSRGMKQKVALAGALVHEPELIILDEATASLDVSVQATVLDLLARLQQERGLTYLFIGHDLAVIERVSHDVLVLRGGEAVEYRSAAELFAHPEHEYTRALLAAVPPARPGVRR